MGQANGQPGSNNFGNNGVAGNTPPPGSFGHMGIPGGSPRPYSPPTLGGSWSAATQPSAPTQSKGPQSPGAQPPTSVTQPLAGPAGAPPSQSKGPQAPGAKPPTALSAAPYAPPGDPMPSAPVLPTSAPTGSTPIGVAPLSGGTPWQRAPGTEQFANNESTRVGRYYDDNQIQSNFDRLFRQDPNLAMAYTEQDPRTQQWRMKNQQTIANRYFGGMEGDQTPQAYRQWVNHNLGGNDLGLDRSNPAAWAQMRALHGFGPQYGQFL